MPKVHSEKFFRSQSLESRAKADIVSAFARAWFNVFLGPKLNPSGNAEVAYIDLFSGPGIYDDGGLSTPLFVTRSVISEQRFRQGVRLFFNDQDALHVTRLREEIRLVNGSDQLNFPPLFFNGSASQELVRSLQLPLSTPKLFFLDQFGWADVKPELLKEVFRNPKCDCLLFVRTSRLQAAITNDSARETLNRLFGAHRLNSMREQAATRIVDRQDLVLAALKEIANEAGATEFQAFPFRVTPEHRPKHHLIYLGKHPLPLKIIRSIMATKSSEDEFGVPIIGHVSIPSTTRTMSLFATDPIEELAEDLVSVFKNKKLRVIDVYFAHQSTSSRFLLNHYQEALRRLEEREQVTMIPERTARPKRQSRVTVAENVQVIFNTKGKG